MGIFRDTTVDTQVFNNHIRNMQRKPIKTQLSAIAGALSQTQPSLMQLNHIKTSKDATLHQTSEINSNMSNLLMVQVVFLVKTPHTYDISINN